MERKKVLELDKICRVCISERKDMRPLFDEKVAEMLMEFAKVKVEEVEGWPDKICVQCVHQISRCHAFKGLAERRDRELREYIKSLTVRVVVDDQEQQQLQLQREHELTLQKSQAKLLQLQKQQQQLEQQRILQEQQQQKELQEKQQLLEKRNRKQRKKLLEEKEKQRQLEQKVALQQQQQHLVQLVTNSSASNSTTNALPQHVLLSNNGQIITTAQILTQANPQITPLTASSATATFSPQLLQTNGGQLQIIQQPNGQHTLQLVQIVPQRSLGQGNLTATTQNIGNIVTLTSSNEEGETIVNLVDDSDMAEEDGDSLLDETNEQHLLDDEDNDISNLSVQDEETEDDAEDEDNQLQVLDTIIIKDDSPQDQQTQLITMEDYDNHETQELEYLEDITVTTSAGQQQQQHQDHQHMQQMHAIQHDDQIHDLVEDENDDDIIEEIQMDEEMLEADGISNSIIRIVDNNGTEFICPDTAPEMDEGDNEVQEVELQHFQAVNDTQGNVLHYSLVDEDGNNTIIGREVLKNSNILLENNNAEMHVIPEQEPIVQHKTQTVGNKKIKQTKAQTTQHKSAPAINSRVLAATASSIAAAASDNNCEVDDRLIAEFINQHSSPLCTGRYVCNLCRQEFKQYKGLQNHMHSHINWIRANCKKQPQCEICYKSFKGPGMLKMHMKTHLAESRTPTCNICNKSFKSKAILYRHRQTHQMRSYACAADHCRKTFSAPGTLKTHSEQKHPQCGALRYKCGGCFVLFDDIELLQQHVQLTGHGVGDRMVNVGNAGGILVVPSDVIVVTQA